MARTATEPSAAQKAFETAKEALAAAKEKAKEKDTEQNKRAVEMAAAKLKDAAKVANRDRFVTGGRIRVNKVLGALEVLSQCANRKSYDFSEDDIKRMTDAINGKFTKTMTAFQLALKAPVGESKTATNEGFSF